MDDELIEFEADLKRLRLAPPSRDLLVRIERELDSPAPRLPRVWWLLAGALPAAAALAIVIAFLVGRDRTRVDAADVRPPAPFQPVAAENLLYAARDEGLVTLADGTPARRERFSYVDTITWKNPRTNASVRWSVPREEVRVVPVNFQ